MCVSRSVLVGMLASVVSPLHIPELNLSACDCHGTFIAAASKAGTGCHVTLLLFEALPYHVSSSCTCKPAKQIDCTDMCPCPQLASSLKTSTMLW